MNKLLTILLILVSTIAFSQTDTPTHISKLEKQYDTHKALGWTTIGLSGGFYTLSIANTHRVNQLTPNNQRLIMGTAGFTLNIKGLYHLFKAKKIKKQIYTQKYIINLYSYE